MNKTFNILLLTFLFTGYTGTAQDTYSIVALDTATRQVGGAGASCVDLTAAFSDGFLIHLFPDTGAIATQAHYLPANQQNAAARMRSGDNADAIINYLENNDVNNTPQKRQYGVTRFSGNNGEARAFTGIDCNDYKNHITGSIDGFYYSIQGNILLGPQVLTQMEDNFIKTKGDLTCRLMAAMQGAKMVGADTRCAANNTSSLFAFLKVSNPTDAYEQPSLLVAVRTHNGQQIEPVDSLQKLLDLAHPCAPVSIKGTSKMETTISIFPNPSASGQYTIIKKSNLPTEYTVCNLLGMKITSGKLTAATSIISLPEKARGIYFIYFRQEGKLIKTDRLIIQ